MRIGSIEIKRRVWVGLASVLVTTTAWWFWARANPPAVNNIPAPNAAFVRLTRESHEQIDKILRERGEYFDPTPLFFPTDRNFGQTDLKERILRQPDQVFANFDPKWQFGDQNIPTGKTEVAAAPEHLADVLSSGNGAPFGGMGQTGRNPPVLVERSGFLEVRNLADGKIIASQSLTNVSLPRVDFEPLEFVVAVSAAGLIGDPVLKEGSGWDEVDVFLRNYLVKSWRLGDRLNPGRYRVLIGP